MKFGGINEEKLLTSSFFSTQTCNLMYEVYAGLNSKVFFYCCKVCVLSIIQILEEETQVHKPANPKTVAKLLQNCCLELVGSIWVSKDSVFWITRFELLVYFLGMVEPSCASWSMWYFRI